MRYPVDRDADMEKEGQDIYMVEYRNVELGQRIVWTAKRGEVIDLADKLSKLQIRRIGKQVNDIAR